MITATSDVICNAEQKAHNCLQEIVKYQLQVQLQYCQTQHTQLTMCCSRHVARGHFVSTLKPIHDYFDL